MQFIAIRILLISLLAAIPVNAQPTPTMSEEWRALALPKIKKNFDKELKLANIKPSNKTILVARAYIEKNGSVKSLRIAKKEVESDMKKADLILVENALLKAIRKSAPLPYKNVADCYWKHVGLYLQYDASQDKLDGGETRPKDFPGS